MLAMMAAAIEAITATSARFERAALDRTRLEADINAGLARAVLGIGDPRAAERWRVDGATEDFVYNGDAEAISVQDEGGRIDLNAADASTIKQLLVSVGLAKEDADALGDAIFDWRTPVSDDNPNRLHGTTDGEYEAAGRAYRPRHGPFQSIDELNLVLGMTPALFSRLKPALTVYSRSDKADLSVAPPEVVHALLPSGPTATDAPPQSGSMFGHDVIYPGTVQDVAGLAGRSFAISVRAEHAGKQLSRDVVIVFTNDKTRLFLVEAWE